MLARTRFKLQAAASESLHHVAPVPGAELLLARPRPGSPSNPPRRAGVLERLHMGALCRQRRTPDLPLVGSSQKSDHSQTTLLRVTTAHSLSSQ